MKQSSKIFVVLLCFFVLFKAHGQGLKKGDQFATLKITRLLNSGNPGYSFNDLQKKITILDFFGTWCMPCVKAIPHLNLLQQKFPADIAIVMVSDETEIKLQKFINSRKNFSFPIIVDENSKWSNLFQPPALPYTVILNASGKIIEVTSAEDITETDINRWLNEKVTGAATNTGTQQMVNNNTIQKPNTKSSDNILQLSQDYVYNAKTGESIAALDSQLASVDYQQLLNSLNDDDEKKAFWINLYNAYTQVALKKNAEQYKRRNKFFKAKSINIAGKKFSLDEIEHKFCDIQK